MTNSLTTDNNIDNHVDDEIAGYLTLDKPISFFLFAGAGSGKTSSLVEALKRLKNRDGKDLRLKGKKIAVITYTNKACDEIRQRLEFDHLIEVSTIHSFVWLLIGGFNSDIKEWLQANLRAEIENLYALQAKGRGASKASMDREKSIISKTERLASLKDIKQFTYNPNGENYGKDSLNHSEVIKIGAYFLSSKPLMQNILINRFPVLLIDESQDTSEDLVDALFEVQKHHSSSFALGLIGDTMQRIYADGKEHLDKNLPTDWAKPVKKMNHRCPPRIVKLINKIRSEVDTQAQIPRTDKEEGFARLFIVRNNAPDKAKIEAAVANRMSTITSDKSWSGKDAEIKTLILEHHMAAKRMGFLEMYEPLYKNESLKIGLLAGELSGLKLFSKLVLPVIEAKEKNDEFAIATIVRKYSPLLSKKNLKAAGEDQLKNLEKVKSAVDSLWHLFSSIQEPKFLDILNSVSQSGLFEIPESLKPIAARNNKEQRVALDEVNEENIKSNALDAWDAFLLTPFSQIRPYVEYINDKASFGTHQGVKGLEFPRVMVIIDDSEARGFMFDYSKLFGVKDKTKTDIENENTNKDNSIDRTRRLFYVTCSRAKESLAILAYSENPSKLRDYIITRGWFEESEIETEEHLND